MNRLPLRQILCPMDLSTSSLNSLAWADSIARARSAELKAFHVVVTKGLTLPKSVSARERSEMMLKLRSALATIAPENTRVGAAVRHGDPGSQIVQYARSGPADLIVMAAAGSERPVRPIGSVTATVVARASCPVLIVPAGHAVDHASPGVFRRVVCAVDLAPSSVNVLRQALSLVWETHGRLIVVCVMTEPEPSASAIREHIAAAIPPEAGDWSDIEMVVSQGEPGAELVRVTGASDADLLVIGPPRQWTSTTQAVLATSRCPVLVTHDGRPLPWPLAKHID
jgi:nucleotide-binding universal stress UspA family protein